MTKQKSFKERIRARMAKTGESYATARRQLVEKAEADARKRSTPQTIAAHRPNDEVVIANTGRPLDDWFELLDAWGRRPRRTRRSRAGWPSSRRSTVGGHSPSRSPTSRRAG